MLRLELKKRRYLHANLKNVPSGSRGEEGGFMSLLNRQHVSSPNSGLSEAPTGGRIRQLIGSSVFLRQCELRRSFFNRAYFCSLCRVHPVKTCDIRFDCETMNQTMQRPERFAKQPAQRGMQRWSARNIHTHSSPSKAFFLFFSPRLFFPSAT